MDINKQRLKDTFCELVAIPSPSRNERAAMEHVKGLVEELGYEFFEDDAHTRTGGNCGNLLVKVPATGKGKKIFLSAHVDTVEQGDRAVAPQMLDDDNTIVSDGETILGADDKTGVACMLELLRLLKENEVEHGELLLGFTISEEIELLGSIAMDPEIYQDYEMGIVLDHSDPDQIIAGAPSKAALRITIFGRGGHAAHPERRVNAAMTMCKAISRLPSNRMDEYSTSNIGIIESGSKINIIPDQAYAEYEIRSHKRELMDYHLTRALAIIEGAVRESRIYVTGQEDSGMAETDQSEDPIRKATVEVEVDACYECYRHEEDSGVVQHMFEAIQRTGQTPRQIIAQGGSDANTFNARGLPTVVLGCGMHAVHSVREKACVDEMANCVRVLLEAIAI